MSNHSPRRTPEYRIIFDRLGLRNPQPTVIQAHGADDLAEKVCEFAKNFVLSRWIDVIVDFDVMCGKVLTGGRPAGNFKIEQVDGR